MTAIIKINKERTRRNIKFDNMFNMRQLPLNKN
jgi:hypothetical protein